MHGPLLSRQCLCDNKESTWTCPVDESTWLWRRNITSVWKINNHQKSTSHLISQSTSKWQEITLKWLDFFHVDPTSIPKSRVHTTALSDTVCRCPQICDTTMCDIAMKCQHLGDVCRWRLNSYATRIDDAPTAVTDIDDASTDTWRMSMTHQQIRDASRWRMNSLWRTSMTHHQIRDIRYVRYIRYVMHDDDALTAVRRMLITRQQLWRMSITRQQAWGMWITCQQLWRMSITRQQLCHGSTSMCDMSTSTWRNVHVTLYT